MICRAVLLGLLAYAAAALIFGVAVPMIRMAWVLYPYGV
jgi:hypothetical protein